MSEQTEQIEMIIISAGERMIGVDFQEVEELISGFDPEKKHRAMISDYESKGARIRLSDFLRLDEPQQDNSAFIVNIGDADRKLITFSGTMEKKTIPVSGIIPVPGYIRNKQDPFVVWGFGREESEMSTARYMLITFQFLQEKGAL